jgi:hypothetical protein
MFELFDASDYFAIQFAFFNTLKAEYGHPYASVEDSVLWKKPV